ncbi:MAG: hypothetical protein QOJ48_397 [Frankiales bacterium]|nr:hypothetical protein [Frankiales bacterium]
MAVQDVIAAGRRRRPGLVVLVSAGLLLVLIAAAAALVVLHRRDQHADQVARIVLSGAPIGLSAVGVASNHRVAVVLTITSGTTARVVDAHVTGTGWEAVHGSGVGLARDVDCLGDPPLPTSAEAVLELHGQRRAVDLLTDAGLVDVLRRTGREACGDVDARRALSLKASGTVRRPGGGLQLALVVINRSTHSVTVRGIAVAGLHATPARRLPLVLRPRTTVRMMVVLDPRGCGRGPAVVALSIDGLGGPAYVSVASADLPQLAAQVRKARCG